MKRYVTAAPVQLAPTPPPPPPAPVNNHSPLVAEAVSALSLAMTQNVATHAESISTLRAAIATSDKRIAELLTKLTQVQSKEVRVKIVRDSNGDMSELIITKE